MLILVGSAVIVYEAVRRLVEGSHVDSLGFGFVIMGLSVVANLAVSAYVGRTAREHQSDALAGDAAHLRTDAATSAGVLVGLVLVQVTDEQWIDSVVALIVAAAIVVAGLRILLGSSRVLVDEALPATSRRRSRMPSACSRPRVVGYHKLRTRRAGARRHVDMHVQFRSGTTLEDAHATAHALQDEIRRRLGDADVLIHLEPEDRVRPGTELVGDG